MATQAIILFDGDCAYCNGWVKWIAKRDVLKHFRFVALLGKEGQALRVQYSVPDHVDSVVLIGEGRAYLRSQAAWRVLRELPGWHTAALALRIVPRPLRDLGYDLIARNRHRLGMKDSCELPTGNK